MSKYDKFITGLLTKIREFASTQRNGQILMNYLFFFDKEEYEKITSAHYYDKTNVDCFYLDKLIPNTLERLQKVWKDQ
jgi:hypothetical protein